MKYKIDGVNILANKKNAFVDALNKFWVIYKWFGTVLFAFVLQVENNTNINGK